MLTYSVYNIVTMTAMGQMLQVAVQDYGAPYAAHAQGCKGTRGALANVMTLAARVSWKLYLSVVQAGCLPEQPRQQVLGEGQVGRCPQAR